MDPIHNAVLDALTDYFTDGGIGDFIDTRLWHALEGNQVGIKSVSYVGRIALIFLEDEAGKPGFGGEDIWALQDLLIDVLRYLVNADDADPFHAELGQRLVNAYKGRSPRGDDL